MEQTVKYAQLTIKQRESLILLTWELMSKALKEGKDIRQKDIQKLIFKDFFNIISKKGINVEEKEVRRHFNTFYKRRL